MIELFCSPNFVFIMHTLLYFHARATVVKISEPHTRSLYRLGVETGVGGRAYFKYITRIQSAFDSLPKIMFFHH